MLGTTTITPAVPLVREPVHGIRQLPPSLNIFHPVVADEVSCVVGSLYSVIFFDIFNWCLRVKASEGIRVNRNVVTSADSDHAHIHALGNFAQTSSESILCSIAIGSTYSRPTTALMPSYA